MAYSQGKSAISEEIDVSDGGVFNGTIDITNGDCNTPIYKIDEESHLPCIPILSLQKNIRL
ncbi:MAG: hypothetical protein OSJ43_13365 [Oscillospiraceae bacterium]|nr:hypothetical protein [Oscillospiraceae bacterium]